MSDSNDNNSQQSAASLLLSKELFELCKSESLSEEELRDLIARHGLTHNNNHAVSDYKFFFEVCKNKRVTEEIIRCLLEYFPQAASAVNNGGVSPLHLACCNKNVTPNIVHFLIDAAPDSIRSVDIAGDMPLHNLCNNKKVGEASVIQILKLLIEKYPEAARHANIVGNLPIHFAAGTKSPEFCRVLIDKFPGSKRIANANGALLLHCACSCNSLATVEYVYKLFPDAIHRTTTAKGFHPIHMAIVCAVFGGNPATGVEIIQFLLNCDPNQKLIRYKGGSLLQFACGLQHNDLNIEAGLQMIKVIYDSHPDSVRSVNNEGNMPLHNLCCTSKVDEAAAMQILKFLLEKHPESVRHADNEGRLPIHFAAGTKSPDFCRVLIDAYSGSERITATNGALPLDWACSKGSLATVEYLYRQYPEAINHADAAGFYPIHLTILGIKNRDIPASAVEIVRFLLESDPNQKLIQFQGRSLLRVACVKQYNNSNIGSATLVIKIVFDAYPEAIEDNGIAHNIHHYHQQVQEFLNGELGYARQAKDLRLMNTPDANGQLLLHRALQNNVRLGSLKLLVKGNPSAIRNADNNLAMPLHIACQYHDSVRIIQYLLSLDEASLDAVDRQWNTALHYACRGAKHQTIALLLEKYDAASVSKRNAHGKLPIDLLWESNEVSDRESVEYMGSVFQLVRADPEMVTISNSILNQHVDADATRNGKKRKLCHDHQE